MIRVAMVSFWHVHARDYARQASEHPDTEIVAASEVAALLSQHRLHFMDGEDTAQIMVRFKDGSVGTLVTSWAQEMTQEKFSVIGELGRLSSNGAELQLTLRGKKAETFTFPQVNSFDAEIADFVDCLIEKRQPLQTQEDGINVLKVILGAYQADTEKRTIKL